MHHFAHEGDSECAGGLQTALHLAAKSVLSKERRMVLPGLTLTATAYDAEGNAHTVSETPFSDQTVVFDAVKEERRLGDIIPDLICMMGQRVLLVEIAVTHFVDESKRRKIQANGLACIEIDLSSMTAVWDWDTLKNAVVDSIAHKAWVENPKVGDLLTELQRRAQQMADTADRDRLDAKRNAIPGLATALRRLEEFRDVEKSSKFQQEREAWNRAGPSEKLWKSAASLLKLEWNSPPDYIDIEVPDESAFLIARKVWQAALYVYLLSQAKVGSGQLYPGTIALRCVLMFPVRSEFDVLREHRALLTESELEAIPNLITAITAYLDALVDLGHLKCETASGKTYSFERIALG